MKKFYTFLIFLLILTSCTCQGDDDIDTPTDVKYYTGSLLLIDQSHKYLEVEDCPATRYDSTLVVSRYINDTLVAASLNDLYLGMDHLYLKVVDDLITHIIIDGNHGFKNIRIAIRKTIGDIANPDTLYHDQVTMSSSKSGKIKVFDNELSTTFASNTFLYITTDGAIINVHQNGELIFSSSKRIIFSSDDLFRISSISRSLGVPTYPGNIEVSLINGRLLLTNHVDIEEYLKRVVPSEMPASSALEALKAQSIAARTFAVNDILNSHNKTIGFSVDDSESSQVYNNQSMQSKSSQAVEETQGLAMYSQGAPIIAYYYSASSGLTASGHEVWIKDQIIDPIPYLLGKNITDQDVDTSDEASLTAFFKQIKMYNPAGNSNNHRWHIVMTKEQLRNTLNVNMKNIYNSYPESVLTKVGDTFVSQTLPSDLGTIYSINVSKRGSSGVVVSVNIETSTGTYQIINQYNIRFSIRPKDAQGQVKKEYAKSSATSYTATSYNDSILPSGFFIIETVNDDIHFYGGGSGHGVGMCQNSAMYLGSNGYTCNDILLTFYSNTDIINKQSTFAVRNNYQTLFDL